MLKNVNERYKVNAPAHIINNLAPAGRVLAQPPLASTQHYPPLEGHISCYPIDKINSAGQAELRSE